MHRLRREISGELAALDAVLRGAAAAPGNGRVAITSTGASVMAGTGSGPGGGACAAATIVSNASRAAIDRSRHRLPIRTATTTHRDLAGERTASIGTEQVARTRILLW